MTTMPTAKYRLDYTAPDYTITQVELDIDLHDKQTIVRNTMQVQRQGSHTNKLILDGESLRLLDIKVNGETLSHNQYHIDNNHLSIEAESLPEAFTLYIENEINPSENTALEGLYKSGGAFCTQCEAEGFRRITYYLDRPDVLAVFTTKLHADKSLYPFLLANGNTIEAGEHSDGRHWVKWHDPHPKPCYLFAVVAGDFDVLDDKYQTQDGREVQLQLFVDKGNLQRAGFAMRSLKAAMEWDEKRFGLSYDLDTYMIVAVDFFNMGAMENKGLNIFNSKYVLADAATATDQDFLNVESVIGHEYFHNWTGNRITCRDWFQLSLKEGLTVFRDQEFSGDMSMRPVHRIQDVRILRTHQFQEDASPMAHPIRPDKVIEMNNFYTVTVYNKGAEVIRMMHTLLGEQGFQAGMRLYVQRHDGQAVTCEDFVCAMEDANQADFTQFRRWYEQAGTPELTVREEYDADQQRYILHCSQSTPATPGQKDKKPFHIPLRVEFYDVSGARMELTSREGQSGLLEVKDTEQAFVFESVSAKPVPGLLASFSAPVKLKYEYSESQLLTLLAHGSDPFLCWDAAQQIYVQSLKQAINVQTPVKLTNEVINALSLQLTRTDSDPALVALLLQLPSEEALSGEYDEVPVESIHRACAELRQVLAENLYEVLLDTYHQMHPQGPYEFSADAIAGRMLANTCLAFLAYLTDREEIAELISAQFERADNLTDQFAALQAVVHAGHPLSQTLLDKFDQQWRSNPLVMDKWLAVQASKPSENTLQNVQQLIAHPAFSWNNPNRVYALVATFTHNLAQLHRNDGASYRWLREVITQLNEKNPQVASRLVSALLQWRRFDAQRQQLLRKELQALKELPNLASDLYEKVEQSLKPD